MKGSEVRNGDGAADKIGPDPVAEQVKGIVGVVGVKTGLNENQRWQCQLHLIFIGGLRDRAGGCRRD